MTLEIETVPLLNGGHKSKYTVITRDSGTIDTLVLEKNCNSHGAGECVKNDCRVLRSEGLYYMQVRTKDKGAYLYTAFSDDEMQELFMAYLAMREEIGL